jgi:hypothetical protein
MSSVENWTKRDEWELLCAGERSQHTCDRAPGDQSPISMIMCTRGSLNPAGALDSLKGNSSLLIEGGKLTYGFLRVSRFLGFYESL